MSEPWNLTEAQRRQFREAHAEAKRNPPLPCRFCGILIARDATADWFATDPGNQAPWTCPSNIGGHSPTPGKAE